MAESGGLARVLGKAGFDPKPFVNSISQGGEEDLQNNRRKIQSLAEDTAQALKKNVYRNYSQFIETAKEVSILEGEMYQLSHMLLEQKAIMGAMLETSLTSDKIELPKEKVKEETPEEDTRRNLAFLLEKVEGCSSITEVPGRHLIHNGDLVELDPESYSALKKVHAFLLNDSLMIADWLPSRRGPVRYKFQVLYELDSFAVVNVRDMGSVRNAFKILMFPDSKLYQCDTPKAKRSWLDVIEETKKKKMVSDTLKKEVAQVAERTSTLSVDSGNPFNEDDDEPDESLTIPSEVDLLLKEEWVQDLPEDLDVCIAQRDFEGAVELIDRVNEHLQKIPNSASVKEYRVRIDHRVKQLTEVLMHELQVSPERSLRGGPRAARRAVTHLVKLGKSAQACDLFLKNRSAIIKFNLKQLKFEGATTIYIRTLCNVFFNTLKETGKEFMKAFPEHYACFSAFVVWVSEELQSFVSLFGRQVFASQMSLTTIADCVKLVREHCNQLSDIGLELTFNLNTMLLPDVEKTVADNRDQLIEATKLRAADDLWRPINLHDEDAVDKFVSELEDLGIAHMDKYIYNGCLIALTTNTVQFTRSYLSFLDDLLKLYIPELHHLVVTSLVAIFKSQCKHMETSLNSHKFLREHDSLFLSTLGFLNEALVPLVEERVKGHTQQDCTEFDAVHQELNNIERKLVFILQLLSWVINSYL
ncbi:exocyst complex component 8 isoform X1 [Lingula anatina]|uniref:Exocyst complex component 8 n=1 Tax=Lingula anatina TaxID=7574 RepID=A0A1S3HX88_LINAN|nr:exocyst complex component 8 isoform X2 [Lingula anatina]XP_013390666.1 exocyst complex component 8 isoform X1 [Lingula anatina]|eukprot:XP_013390657.1 exocyst complex component 8 isoform X2 [Lingula anatina]